MLESEPAQFFSTSTFNSKSRKYLYKPYNAKTWEDLKQVVYSRCNCAALSCFFNLSTSFFKNLICLIIFSGESISIDMSLGDGGADTGWSNFSCKILYEKECKLYLPF